MPQFVRCQVDQILSSIAENVPLALMVLRRHAQGILIADAKTSGIRPQRKNSPTS
jgi:hypothetical protein